MCTLPLRVPPVGTTSASAGGTNQDTGSQNSSSGHGTSNASGHSGRSEPGRASNRPTMTIEGMGPNPVTETTETSSSPLETVDLGNWPNLAKHFLEKFVVGGQGGDLEATQIAPKPAITGKVSLASETALNVAANVYRGGSIDVDHPGELHRQILTPHGDPHPLAQNGLALRLWCGKVVRATASEHGGGEPWLQTR